MDDLSPGRWPITRTRGDTNTATSFTLERDGSPWVVDSARAQVRQTRDRNSDLVLELGATVAANVVTVGAGVELDVPVGGYWWDLEVVDDGAVLTVATGPFTVLHDVTEEEGS